MKCGENPVGNEFQNKMQTGEDEGDDNVDEVDVNSDELEVIVSLMINLIELIPLIGPTQEKKDEDTLRKKIYRITNVGAGWTGNNGCENWDQKISTDITE